jgi:GNAT superfamily N-acetyltransferase
VGCGGWSKRKTLYGGDQWTGREAALLDPQHDAAKIRAFFIHPSWARRGIGTMILEACENAAVAAGFTRFEMGATLTGVLLYQARGYVALENLEVPLAKGEALPIVRMEKRIAKPVFVDAADRLRPGQCELQLSEYVQAGSRARLAWRECGVTRANGSAA